MKYFTMDEMIRSATAEAKGIDNAPDAGHEAHIKELVDELLDPLREEWESFCGKCNLGSPGINVTSGYRSPALNKAVGGSNTSAHSHGYAADLVPVNGRLEYFKSFCKMFLSKHDFDQMISEDENGANIPRWIHIGIRNGEGKQRRQFLTMKGGKYFPMT